MQRALLALVAGAALTAFASMASGQALRLPPDPPSVFKQPVVDLGAVNMLPDIVYTRPPGYRPLKLDIYRPKQQGALLPAVIWLHGGGWANGDQRGAIFAGTDMPAMLAEMAGRGYVVAGVSYRLTGEAQFPAQGQDVRAAIRWLRANATEYGIDASKIIVTGGSAGGYLAAQAGVACGDAGLNAPPVPPRGGGAPPAPPAPGSECVQGVVAFYPVVDLPSLPPSDPTARFLGCAVAACPAEKVALASVVNRIDAKDPPFLILHGDADTTVSVSQSQMLQAALKAKGVPSELIVVPGGTHVFPNMDPAARKALMDRVYAFMDKQTGKKR